MKKIRVWWASTSSNGFSGLGDHEAIEVPADATDYDIEEAARETALEHLSWGYEEVEK